MSIFDLSGRVAVVTGGNGGIGLGIAQALEFLGQTVYLFHRILPDLGHGNGRRNAIPIINTIPVINTI